LRRETVLGNFEGGGLTASMFNQCILKPRTILFQANAVDEVVDGFLQTESQQIMINTRAINEANVVLAKRNGWQGNNSMP